MNSLLKKTKTELVDEIIRLRSLENLHNEQGDHAGFQITEDLVNALPIGIFVYKWIKPDKLFLISGNAESKILSGIDSVENAGREFIEIWPEAEQSGITKLFINVLESGETFETEELTFRDERLKGVFRIKAFGIPGNRLVVAFENVTENIREKEETKKRIKELKVITNIFSDINSCNNIKEIFKLVGQHIYDMDQEAYITTCIFNSKSKSIRILYAYGLEEYVGRINEFAGIDLFNMDFSVDDFTTSQKETYTSSRIEEKDGGLYDILLKKLSRKKCQDIENLLAINKVYRIGFRVDNLPYGGVFIFYKKDKPYPFRLTVETIVNYAKTEINRRLDNELLRKEKEFTEGILNAINDTVYVYDINNDVPLRWNNALNKISGYSDKEIYKMKAPDDWYDTKEIEKLGSKIQNFVEDENGRIELNLITKNGGRIPTEYTGNLVKDKEGNSIYTISVGRDIRERNKMLKKIKEFSNKQKKLIEKKTGDLNSKAKKLESSQVALSYLMEDVNEARSELVKTNLNLSAAYKDMESFSYSVSHDLKAPIRAVGGFSHILYEDYYKKFDEDGRLLLQRIIRNADLMTELIEDLLQFSRIGRQKMNISDIDIKAIFTNIFVEARNNKHIIENEYIIKAMPKIRADRVLMRQVISNLISNAIKYTKNEDQKLIEVGSRTENNVHVFWVKDNGVGFDNKYSDKLFGVFQRLHHSEDFEGTGVGLATVKRIISKHGGHVWADGKINEGAIFYFSLPVL